MILLKSLNMIEHRTILIFFSLQHSKTECTVKGFGFTPGCRSSVQGVHHTVVAVKLGLRLLTEKKLALVFLHLHSGARETLDVSQAGRVTKKDTLHTPAQHPIHSQNSLIMSTRNLDFVMGKWLDLFIISLFSFQYFNLAECIIDSSELTATCHLETSSARAPHNCDSQEGLRAEDVAVEQDDAGTRRRSRTQTFLVDVGLLQPCEDGDSVWFLQCGISGIFHI